MLNLRAVLALLALPCAYPLSGQSPHLEGTVVVGPSAGLLAASVCLTNFAPRRALHFLLGAPLNIKAVSAGDGHALAYEGDYGGRMVGEAREYIVRQPDSLPPLAKVCVDYRGAVPIFETNSATADWKGRIVATNGTLRAAEQTRWYPTLFDSATDRKEDVVTYNLRLQCATCRSIYVNGSPPVADTLGTFRSATPRALLLYAGDFRIRSDSIMTLLGGAAHDSTVSTFDDAIHGIGAYYERSLGIPYGERPTLLSFRSVSRDYQLGTVNWQFVTWPTITFSGGLDFDQLVERNGGKERLPDWLWGSLSHEMAHYYFGTLRFPVGPLGWYVMESTAEYLSLKSVATMRGDDALSVRAVNYLGEIGTTEFPALNAVTDNDPISDAFRYRFAPLALLSLDRRVGEARVFRMLRALLEAPSAEPADYAQLARAARIAGISPDELTAPSTAAVRTETLAFAAQTMKRLTAAGEDTRAIALGSALVDADTILSGRLEVMEVLRTIANRDSANLAAQYQIGKIGALTGHELDVAEHALKAYLRFPVASGNPSHAAAYWRLGAIAALRGDVERARMLYQTSLNMEPGNAAVLQALTRLSVPKNAP